MGKFKVGDRVELVEYGPCIDYKDHEGESATIINNETFGYDWRIKWDNGDISCIHEENLIKKCEFVFGQKILVWDDDEPKAEEMIFLFRDTRVKAEYSFVCVNDDHNDKFESFRDVYKILAWKNAKPLNDKVTISCEGKDVFISRESAKALGLVK